MVSRRLGAIGVAAFAAVGWPAAAAAHGSAASGGELSQVLTSWSLEPLALLLIVALGGGYVWLWRRMRAQAARLRISRWRAAAFGAGVVVLGLALVSPIDAYSDDLFWAHMVQHVLLMSVAAPLLLLGKPITVLLRGASPRVRRSYLIPVLRSRALAVLALPALALVLFVVTIWVWHLPALYDAAVGSEVLHVAEHFSFLSAALLFWWLIIDADRSALRRGHIVRAALLFVATVQGLMLGVVLLMLDEVPYAAYEAAALRAWGPSALSDLRAGAGLVWIPSGLIFVLALLVTFQAWFEAMEQRAKRDDALRVRAFELEHGS